MINTVEDVEKKLTHGLIAFIDVLGFANAVENCTTPKDVLVCIQKIRRIRDYFEAELDKSENSDVDALYDKRAFSFSDCIVIHTPFSSEACHFSGTFDTCLVTLHDFCMAQAQCVLEGTFIRGGLDLNWWYDADDVLISQGLTESYYLEGKASVPVLALTERIYKHFSEHKDKNTYSESWEPTQYMIRKTKIKNKNGDTVELHFLNYFLILLRDAEVVLPYNEEELKEFSEADRLKDKKLRDELSQKRFERAPGYFADLHAKAIQLAYLEAPEKAKDKYLWLRDYHNETVRSFFSNPLPHECVL